MNQNKQDIDRITSGLIKKTGFIDPPEAFTDRVMQSVLESKQYSENRYTRYRMFWFLTAIPLVMAGFWFLFRIPGITEKSVKIIHLFILWLGPVIKLFSEYTSKMETTGMRTAFIAVLLLLVLDGFLSLRKIKI
jgi:hypothetical protein